MAFPTLYQINTRVVLQEIQKKAGRIIHLSEWPAEHLDAIAEAGFDWVWFLGVWQTSSQGRKISQTNPAWLPGFYHDLPDLSMSDIVGSPYAIQSYKVHEDFGGDESLEVLRERLANRGLRLMLDFVPNHVAIDHQWIDEHPEFFLHGKQNHLVQEPNNYISVPSKNGPLILAHGRDPYFPGWVDTLQLNYRHPGLRSAQIQQMLQIAGRCDGMRCDMAMLLLPDVFLKTWGEQSRPVDESEPVDVSFWPEAIARVKTHSPGFVFLAEVYWNLEWNLQQQGFDYTYDKRLLDRLHASEVGSIRGHLQADIGFQNHLARFLENHDEERAATAFLAPYHQAAAVVTYTIPGLRFFHEGQLEGRRSRVSIHLGRRAPEEPDPVMQHFYHALLRCLKLPPIREGQWQLRESRSAWEGNPTAENLLIWTWEHDRNWPCLICINFSSCQSQCYVQLPIPVFKDRQILLVDSIGSARYLRDGNELMHKGLYLDLLPWNYHIFQFEDAEMEGIVDSSAAMIHL